MNQSLSVGKKTKKIASKQVALSECVALSLEQYFDNLGGETPTGLYDLVLHQVEPPMLRAVLEHTDHNQSRAAEMLGLNRGTLRKKLKQYDLI